MQTKTPNNEMRTNAMRGIKIKTQLCSWKCHLYMFMSSCFSPSVFEEPEDPSNRSFFSEIISSISDVKFSHSGRYLMTRDYLTVKVWDINMESKPLETYQVLAKQIGQWSMISHHWFIMTSKSSLIIIIGQILGIDHLCFWFYLWQVHDYLRSKLCSLYENDCIFDKFECVWNGTDRSV